MTRGDGPASDPDRRLADLGDRLRARRETERAKGRRERNAAVAGLGIAWRVSLEIVVALGVGAAMGFGLDQLFGTTPWFMLGGLFFGFAAGVRNVVRAAAELQKVAESADGVDER